MVKRKEDLSPDRLLALVDRHWKLVVVVAWALLCAWYVNERWSDLRAFALGDTDDNMRMMQVRALLHGQDWFDLRQYRLNPPYGANMHWSHLVDLPLAGLILLLRPFVGGPLAELYAAGFAPLIPLLVLLFGLALIARRLIHPAAYPLVIVALFFAGSTTGMFMPTRIDHHGWQLALLSIAVAGIADPRRARGGVTLGVASALSLAIGLELLVYLALAGVATVLFWVADLCGQPGGRRLILLPGIRVLRKPGGGLRRSLAGVARGRHARRSPAVRPVDADHRGLEAAVDACVGSGRGAGAVPRAGVAALPAAARRRFA
jgi:hypothetical protein